MMGGLEENKKNEVLDMQPYGIGFYVGIRSGQIVIPSIVGTG